jgi:hypothetical protein
VKISYSRRTVFLPSNRWNGAAVVARVSLCLLAADHWFDPLQTPTSLIPAMRGPSNPSHDNKPNKEEIFGFLFPLPAIRRLRGVSVLLGFCVCVLFYSAAVRMTCEDGREERRYNSWLLDFCLIRYHLDSVSHLFSMVQHLN